MIKIIKDISVFGFKIHKGAEINIPKDVDVNTMMLIVKYIDDISSVSLPIVLKAYDKTAIEFLDEIRKLNT
jgi:hypothetical protein